MQKSSNYIFETGMLWFYFKQNCDWDVQFETYDRLLTSDKLSLQRWQYLETACNARNHKPAISDAHRTRG